ncbi:response regulator transcription factor [Clostridium estertheticum]|uniref:response regulator transcription factor n=1 Tax=Clostridium estertheticum TaxID=238834 RepID=UPI001C7D79CF|nr:response regulator transcription factor [Clostridium estertheticum]MBX4259646.1 response regulator transcription factor [Clostridium estertheticum]WLC70530.1 response regulator transcription factor [Clostridium estertheticum]
MAHILICDDDLAVHSSLGIYLEVDNFLYTSVYDGKESLQKALDDNFDLIILDIMMPYLSGIEVCKEIRKVSKVPIIILTAKGEEIDILLGLELGADDYIVKPFNPREVIARVKAVLRRLEDINLRKMASVIKFSDLEVNVSSYKLLLNNDSISATPKEIEILFMLLSNPGVVLSRDEILDKIWGADYTYVDRRTIDTHINRIRSHLPRDYAQRIQSIYGVGYKFEAGI